MLMASQIGEYIAIFEQGEIRTPIRVISAGEAHHLIEELAEAVCRIRKAQKIRHTEHSKNIRSPQDQVVDSISMGNRTYLRNFNQVRES